MTRSNNSGKTRHFKTAKENPTIFQGKNARRHIYNRMRRKQNNFGEKYGNGKIITEKPNNMKKVLQELEEGPKAKIRLDSLKTLLKREPKWKMANYDGIHGH